MKDDKNDFLEFITQSEIPPKSLSLSVKQDILLSFHKKAIIAKFIFFQILGAALTLSFCPQFGIGLVDGHSITHFFRLLGDWVCASFCGSLFLSSGMLVAYLGMKGDELWWVWRHYKYSLILFPPALWFILMLTNVSLNLESESVLYHLTWIVAALLSQAFWLTLRSKTYQLKLIRNSRHG